MERSYGLVLSYGIGAWGGIDVDSLLLAPRMQGMHHSTNMGMAFGLAGIVPSALGLAVIVHTLGLLLVSGVIALLFYQFYEKWGLGLLRHAWFNFDLLWAFALIIAGAIALVI